MIEVLTIVLALGVAVLFALCLTLLNVAKSLRRKLAETTKHLARIEKAMHEQERRVAKLDAQLSMRPKATGIGMMPLVDAAMNYRQRGIVPTILMLAWNLMCGWLRQKETARLRAKQ